MASPNDDFPFGYSGGSKRPRGLVDPYEIPDSPPPPKRQRQPLPAKRLKAYARKQPAPPLQSANQAVNTPSRQADGYAYGHGNTWGTVEQRLVLKSNGIEEWEEGMPWGSMNNLRDITPWNSTLEQPTPVGPRDKVVGSSPNVGAINNPPDRTLKIRDLVEEEAPVIVQAVGHNGPRLDTISNAIMPMIAPVANMTAPLAGMMSMNAGDERSSPIMTPSYRSPYIVTSREGQGQIYMPHIGTTPIPIARASTASQSPRFMTPMVMAPAPAMSTTHYHPTPTPIVPAPVPALVVAAPIMPRLPASTTPVPTASGPAAVSPVQQPPTAPQLLMAPRIIAPAIRMPQTPAREIAAVVPVTSSVTYAAHTPLPSAPPALALGVSTAPIARAVSADNLPEPIPHAQQPNGVEQIARRYSLQDYSVTEYSVVGSPLPRAIRVLRPGADKPLMKDTSAEFCQNNKISDVDAPTRSDTERKGAPVAMLPSSEDASCTVNVSLEQKEQPDAEVAKDISSAHQFVEVITESNSLEANSQHTLTSVQKSVSPMPSPKISSPGSLSRRRSEQGAKHPAQLHPFESSTAANCTSEDQRTISYLPTPVDDRRRDDEDRVSKNGHLIENNIIIAISQDVSEKPNTESDDLHEGSSDEAPSRSLDMDVENQMGRLPDKSPNDPSLPRPDRELEIEVLEIPNDAEDKQISREPDTAIEHQTIGIYDGLTNMQIPAVEAHTAGESEADASQSMSEMDKLPMDLDAPLTHEIIELLSNTEDHSPDRETRSNTIHEINERQVDIHAERASMDLDETMENRRNEMKPTVSEDQSPGDSNPENQDQRADQNGTLRAIRAGFHEIIDKLDAAPDEQNSSNEFRISIEAENSKNSQSQNGAQGSPLYGAVSETGDSILSDVEGVWEDTYVESDMDVTRKDLNENDIPDGNHARRFSNDEGAGDDKVQVDSIQGHRMDAAGNTEYLVKWEDANRAVSWESEDQVLDLASGKLYEFFKKLVFENIGPESIVQSKRGPSRQRESMDKSRRQKPSLDKAPLEPMPKVVEKRASRPPRGIRNRGIRSDPPVTTTIATGGPVTTDPLAELSAEASMEHARRSRRRDRVSRETRKNSSNTSLPIDEVVEESEALAEPSKKWRPGRSRQKDNNTMRTESLTDRVEGVAQTIAIPSEVPVKRAHGRSRKSPLVAIHEDSSATTRVTKPPTKGKKASVVSLVEDDGDNHDGSQGNPVHSDSASVTPVPESSAQSSSAVFEISSGRRSGRHSGNLNLANEENSPMVSHIVQPTITRRARFAKRGHGRTRGNAKNVRRKAAEPTLITRIKTMARENRGRPPSPLFGEVFLPWVSRTRQTRAELSEPDENARSSERTRRNLREPENEWSRQAEAEPDQPEVEHSETDEFDVVKSGSKVTENAQPKPQARKARGKPSGIQKQARRGRASEPTIATRMKTVRRGNRGQPLSYLPGQIVMPWSSRRRIPRVNSSEAKQPIDAGMHVEAEFDDLDAAEQEVKEVEEEGTEPTTAEVRPKRETRNHMPKYHDALRFDDLEEHVDNSTPKARNRRRQSSHVTPSTATNEEDSQSRPISASASAESSIKNPRGRGSGSRYVKDRWYYAPY